MRHTTALECGAEAEAAILRVGNVHQAGEERFGGVEAVASDRAKPGRALDIKPCVRQCDRLYNRIGHHQLFDCPTVETHRGNDRAVDDELFDVASDDDWERRDWVALGVSAARVERAVAA